MKDRFINRVTSMILAYPRGILILLGLVTLGLGVSLCRFSQDNSIENMAIGDDPELLLYREFTKEFGSNDTFFIGWRPKALFTPETFRRLDEITTALETVNHVDRVLSLVHVDEIRLTGEGIEVGPLVSEIPETADAMEALREKILADPFCRNLLVTRDGTCALITVLMVPLGKGDKARLEASREIDRILSEMERDGDQFYKAGTVYSQAKIFETVDRDTLIFVPMILGIIATLLYLLYRRITDVLLPLITISISLVWSIGLFFLLGRSFNWITSLLPTLLTIVTVGVSIHVIAERKQQAERGLDPRAQIKGTLERILVPCLMTSLTTAAGLFSLGASRIHAIREFSLFGGIGILFAFLVSILLIPTVYRCLPADPSRPRKKEKGSSLPMRLTEGVRKGRWAFPAVGMMILCVLPYGIERIDVETDVVKYYKEGSEMDRCYQFFRRHHVGYWPFDIWIRATAEGSLKSPRALRKIEELTRFLGMMEYEGDSLCTGTISLLHPLKTMNRMLHDGDDAFYAVPPTREAVAQIALLLEGVKPFLPLADDSLSQLRVMGFYSGPSSNLVSSPYFRSVRRYLEAEFNDPELGIEGRLVGYGPIWTNVADYITRSQIETFSIAFVVIFLLMGLYFRSVKLGLITVLPNLLPIGVSLASMGWLGIPLNNSTAMVASVALGIVVDDTIHFLSRFKEELFETGSYGEALDRTYRSVGQALMVTSLLLAAGFGTLLASDFVPTQQFGFLIIVTVLVALLADLVLLPALLLLTRPFKTPSPSLAEEREIEGRAVSMDADWETLV